jgi:anthranilate phosphoribosyltransferase
VWALLEGAAGPFRDIVVLNSAAALIVAGKAPDLASGARLAEQAVDDGRARKALESLITITNRGTGDV